KNNNTQEILNRAKKLSKLTKMDTAKINESDKKDVWNLKHPDKAKDLMQKEQQLYENGDISQEDYDQQLLTKISEQQHDSLSKKDLQVLAIYREMMQEST
ncbi:penicillin-binding protein 2, partial [Staphylococcus pseudintermedius]